MKNKITAILSIMILVLLLVPATVFADEENKNQAAVIDNADLFTDEEEGKLKARLQELVSYGNMGIITSDEKNGDSAALAREKYIETFGETDGTVLLIDMYNRMIQIFTGGNLYRTLGTTKANEITDNVYTYATNGDYYQAADKAFEQIKITLEGGSILTPMKFATNAAFAIGIVLLINFIIISVQRKKGKAADVLTSAVVYSRITGKPCMVKQVNSVMTKQTRKRHVESSSGGGGGGFSGGGGGGFSGGGGGHSF